MADIIFTEEQAFDNVVLDGKHYYKAYTSIGLVKSGYFRVNLDFDGVDQETICDLMKLKMGINTIPIKSDLITRENYNSSQIIVEKAITDSKTFITWLCLADDPNDSMLKPY